jgi:hypothetical protein
MPNPSQPTQNLPGGPVDPVAGTNFDESGGELFPFDRYDDYDSYGYGPSRRQRIRRWSGRVLVRLGWLGLAAVLALGSAGMVAATSHSPSLGGRQELTWGADQTLSAKLDGAVRDLVLLFQDITLMSDMTRNVLSSLTQVNGVGVSAAQQDGTAALAAIESRTAALRQRLDCGPPTDAKAALLIETYGTDTIDRYLTVCQALDSVAPIAADWGSLVDSSTLTMQVVSDIVAHDRLGTQALQLATAGRFPDALARLAEADKPLAEAASIATRLSAVADLSTLTAWLARSKAFDDALGVLWQAMIDWKNPLAPQVIAALKSEEAAKALLPTSNDALETSVDEMTKILPANGISIENAKGLIANAINTLTGGTVVGG